MGGERTPAHWLEWRSKSFPSKGTTRRPRSCLRERWTSRMAVAQPDGPPPMIATVFPRISSLANCFPPEAIADQAGQLTLLDIPSRQDFQRLPVFLRRLRDTVGGELRYPRGPCPP